jgi:hypothetical protein
MQISFFASRVATYAVSFTMPQEDAAFDASLETFVFGRIGRIGETLGMTKFPRGLHLRPDVQNRIDARDWYFVFVIPSGITLSCPHPHSHGFAKFLKDERLFSAQLELDKDPARDDRVDKKKTVVPNDYKGKRKAADDSGTAVVEGTKGWVRYPPCLSQAPQT